MDIEQCGSEPEALRRLEQTWEDNAVEPTTPLADSLQNRSMTMDGARAFASGSLHIKVCGNGIDEEGLEAFVSEKSPRAIPATSTKRIPLSSLTTASVLDSAAARARAAPQAYVIDAGIGIDTPGGRLRRSSTKANALSFGVTMGSAMADLNMLLASTT